MARENLGRLEFTIRADDLELLHRIARNRGCSTAELVRRSLYDALEPLARAQKEREMKTAAEIEDRRKLAAWIGKKDDNWYETTEWLPGEGRWDT